MDIHILEQFFFWCMVINSGIYLLTVVAVMTMRDFLCTIHMKLFHMDREETLRAVQKYLGNFKLFITVFNFTPWVVLLILQ